MSERTNISKEDNKDKELSLEDKIAIARAPLPAIRTIPSSKLGAGNTTWKNPYVRVDEA